MNPPHLRMYVYWSFINRSSPSSNNHRESSSDEWVSAAEESRSFHLPRDSSEWLSATDRTITSTPNESRVTFVSAVSNIDGDNTITGAALGTSFAESSICPIDNTINDLIDDSVEPSGNSNSESNDELVDEPIAGSNGQSNVQAGVRNIKSFHIGLFTFFVNCFVLSQHEGLSNNTSLRAADVSSNVGGEDEDDDDDNDFEDFNDVKENVKEDSSKDSNVDEEDDADDDAEVNSPDPQQTTSRVASEADNNVS